MTGRKQSACRLNRQGRFSRMDVARPGIEVPRRGPAIRSNSCRGSFTRRFCSRSPASRLAACVTLSPHPASLLIRRTKMDLGEISQKTPLSLFQSLIIVGEPLPELEASVWAGEKHRGQSAGLHHQRERERNHHRCHKPKAHGAKDNRQSLKNPNTRKTASGLFSCGKTGHLRS